MSSSSFKPPGGRHRAPAKSVPFSTSSSAGGGGGSSSSCSFSRVRRSEANVELRKARRGMAVARRRHMRPADVIDDVVGNGVVPDNSDHHHPTSSSSSSTTMRAAMDDDDDRDVRNPYDEDSRRVRETIEEASSIVRIVLSSSSSSYSTYLGWEDDVVARLGRLCLLVTPPSPPDDDDPIPSRVAANSMLDRMMSGGGRGGWDASIDNNLARALAESLRRIIISTSTTTREYYDTSGGGKSSSRHPSLSLARAATTLVGQLAATEPPPPGRSPPRARALEDYSREGGDDRRAAPPPPASWCAALSGLCAPDALPNMLPPDIGAIIVDDDYDGRHDVMLYERCAWAIGNLAGDSESNRTALLSSANDGSSGILPRLTACMSLGTSILRRRRRHWDIGGGRMDDATMVDPVLLRSTADMLRSAIWAVINVIRGGRIVATRSTANDAKSSSTVGFLYVHNDGVSRGGRMDRLLTPEDVSLLLLGPGISPPAVVAAAAAPLPRPRPRTTWDDVAVETCWLLSSLTRDQTMVEYLCSGGAGRDDGDVIPALVERVALATDAAGRRLGGLASSSGNDDEDDVGPGCLVPICRVLRNVANAADDGRHADSILSIEGVRVGGGPGPFVFPRPAESSLARLVVLGTLGAGGDANAIAAEAASTSGACLYRAGLPLPHPATRACEALFPALCGALTCPSSTFELRREAAWALWSAVNFPPDLHEIGPNVMQAELLAGLVRYSPREVAMALTTMLSTMDSDAMEASLRLIDLLLRRLGGDGGGELPTLFEEVGLVDALWRVCDIDSEESFNAEMAAAILDDFYEREDEGDDDADASLRPSSSGGQFQFQIPERGIPPGGFDFGGATNTHPNQRGVQLPPGGRGRGRVLPAWMALN